MNQDNRTIPYMHIVVAFCIVAITGYAGFSVWIIWKFPDATMVGDIIGTWKTFAVAAFAFWIGSSSGGKAQSSNPTGHQQDPVHTKEEGKGDPNAKVDNE